ncbi:MAG: UDP-glucose 4-epimerase GalE [Pseudomonadota bacterium]
MSFRNKANVLVAGGAGYIGSHVVLELVKQGYGVVVLDNLSTGHRELTPGGAFIHGDIGDANLLDAVFMERKIDAVMHFAAKSLVGESVAEPLAYYRNNLACTVSLLEVMVDHRVRHFIFSSSAAVYGEPLSTPIPEDHPRRPVNPYGATKHAVELVLADSQLAYGLTFACLRYFNAAGADESGTIGERHNPESHLIPLVMKVATGERGCIQVFGTDYPTADGTCIRDYVHVSDLAKAHTICLERLLNGGKSMIYNLGSSRGYSVREVIETARRVTGHPIPVVGADRRPGDPAILVADSALIRKELAWKAAYGDLETIIETAWKWHRSDKRSLRAA